MKPILLAVILCFFASAKLQATEALIFDGGGYNIYILVGSGDEKPVVAEVRFTAPRAKDYVSLPRELVQIEKFDMDKQILLLRFPKQNDPALPPPFSLSVKKKQAVLSIKGKEIKSSFDWLEG